MSARDALGTDRLVELLRLYADTNDCPVCFATPKTIGQEVTTFGNGNQFVKGGRWHVEHGLSCDVGRALHRVGTDTP